MSAAALPVSRALTFQLGAHAVDRPYDGLEALSRTLWLGALITASGHPAQRLAHLRQWHAALLAGTLPPPEADFGDPEATQPLRRVMADLALPAMAQGVPAAVQQVLRTALWHLDSLIDRPEGQPRHKAVGAMVTAFREAWTVQRADWDTVAALLQGLGDLALLSWDALRGKLTSREWAQAQALSELLATAPDIVALVRRLGRGVPRVGAARRDAPQAVPQALVRAPVVWRTTVLPDLPGEMHGIRLGANLSRMVPAEAALSTHPILHKLWRARLAESRLQVWDESAQWLEAVRDPRGASHAPVAPQTLVRERGPMIVCVDTSGSMKGAPEPLAKAVVLEAVRTAHRERRACHLIAFGGSDEVLEWSLDLNVHGLDALLSFIGQAFDGGTDIAAPIERAVARVNQHGWHDADLLIVSDGEFGVTPMAVAQLDSARAEHGLRVEGLLIGDRETMGLLEVCDHIHWVRDWRRFDATQSSPPGFSPVHSRSLTALYFPNALSERAARHRRTPESPS